MNRAALESKGLALRTPDGHLILEIPADFGWDDQAVEVQVEILKAFGFDPKKDLIIKRKTSCQLTQ